MKKYDLKDPEVDIRPLDLHADRFFGANCRATIEFPSKIWDAPVVFGVGNRVPNPDFPEKSTQRYAFNGSPWVDRVMRIRDGVPTVKYMNQIFVVRAFERTHASDKKSIVYKAFEMENHDASLSS